MDINAMKCDTSILYYISSLTLITSLVCMCVSVCERKRENRILNAFNRQYV